jgi:rod shape-determining protein MreD
MAGVLDGAILQPSRRHSPTTAPDLRVTFETESALTIPFAVLTALIASLIETTVLPEIPLAGAVADLVLVCAIAATVMFGIEDGILAAFFGGLMVDMLIAARPLGAATISLVLVTGVAALVSRLLSSNRRLMAIVLTILLTGLYHLILAGTLVLTQNAPLSVDVAAILVAAFMNGVLAFLFATLFAAIERRFGSVDRSEWSSPL